MDNASTPHKHRNSSKNTLIELRSTKDQKQLLERAAAVYGVTLDGFVLQSAIERAIAIIQDATVTELSLRDMERFMKILESKSAPNKKLKAAVVKRRKLVRSNV